MTGTVEIVRGKLKFNEIVCTDLLVRRTEQVREGKTVWALIWKHDTSRYSGFLEWRSAVDTYVLIPCPPVVFGPVTLEEVANVCRVLNDLVKPI